MTPARGDGVGLEITTTLVRGVRLDHTDPGRVAAAAEIPIARFDDHATVLDALIRLHGQLDAAALPTRVGWFPPRSTMQRLDVTGRSGPELNALRHELLERSDISSTMLVDAEARRWMLALRWDHAQSWRIQELIERAAFADVVVEPGPAAIERVLARDTTIVRRDASEFRSWVAVYDDAGPLAAATVDTAGRETPALAVSNRGVGVHRLDVILPDDELAAHLGEIVGGAFEPSDGPSELEIKLLVAGDPYPPFPAHDLRAPQRLAVALGAAVGAAGLAGRLRPVDVITSTRIRPADAHRPWAVERLADTAEPSNPGAGVWWRRWPPRWQRRQSRSKIDGR
jgi:hypothetical protein